MDCLLASALVYVQIGALTVAGEGQLTIRPASRPLPIELTQSKGDFYSFCCSYRDDGEDT